MRNICVIQQSFEQHAFRTRIIHVRSCYHFDNYGTAGAVLLSSIFSGLGILQFSLKSKGNFKVAPHSYIATCVLMA